ncbi:transforming growth factor beta-1-induced transcript 1 protein-like [Zerene cesonia]|uniref:transforming growth factor beta-1-induced transcript 1 protein-like n=1 Tax=Zerene cesonia TaxID=33412 RepID=UPI0018E4F1ED|nr:transforming growth factor beta-1-induced transcript 1 protein-like [Zerene cesonia]
MATKDPVICNSCNGAIQGRIVTALNKKWHPEHFTCNSCRKPIEGAKFHQHDGGVHCVPCYTKFHSPRCHGCGDPITDVSNYLWIPVYSGECFYACYYCVSFGEWGSRRPFLYSRSQFFSYP